MPSLSHRQPAPTPPLVADRALAHALLREAVRLRRIAAAYEAAELRDTLTGLASHCEAAAMAVLRHRRGDGIAARIAPAA
ncbi:MAG: hypothetical protein ACREFL_17185 [Stellaceae bacterium]